MFTEFQVQKGITQIFIFYTMFSPDVLEKILCRDQKKKWESLGEKYGKYVR